MIDDDECYADIAYLLPCNSKKFFSGEKEDADY